MQTPVSLSPADRARMTQLVGIATVALRSRKVSEADKVQMSELIGLLASVTVNEELMLRFGDLAHRIHLLEGQVAELQRSGVQPS